MREEEKARELAKNQQPEVPKSVEERANELYPHRTQLRRGEKGFNVNNEMKREAYLQCAKDFRFRELREAVKEFVDLLKLEPKKMEGSYSSWIEQYDEAFDRLEQTLKQD